MALQRINSIYDIAALQEEYGKYVDILTGSQKLLVDLYNVTKANKTVDLSGFTKATDQLSDTIVKATDQSAKLIKVNSDIVNSAKNIITSNVQVGASYKDASGSLEANLQLQLKYKTSLTELRKELKNVQSQNGVTVQSTQELTEKQQNLIEAINQIKTSSPSVQKKNVPVLADLENQLAEIEKLKAANAEAAASNDPLIKKQVDLLNSIENITQASRELQRTIRLQTKENLASEGSLDQLKAKYDRLYQVFRGLSAADQNTEFGQTLLKDLGELSNGINDLQMKAGNFSDNVARYAESLTKPFQTLENKLEEIKSNLSQGIAIGGATDPESLDKTRQAVDAISSSLEKAKQEGQTTKGQMQSLNDAFTITVSALKSDSTNTSFIEQLGQEIGVAKKDINDFEQSIKNLTTVDNGAVAKSLIKPFETIETKLTELKSNLAQGIGIGGKTDTKSLQDAEVAINNISTALTKARSEGASTTQQTKSLEDAFTHIVSSLGADESSSTFIKDLGAQIGTAKNEINSLDQQTQHLINNVNNYSGSFVNAFNVLQSELDGVRQKLITTGKDTPGFKKLEQEERLLTQLTRGLSQSFKNPQQELRAFQNAAKTLGQEFGITSIEFQDFVKKVGSQKNEIDDIQKTINFQASDTKFIDGMIGAVNGLAGAYGVAQSASVLFGNDDEELAKSMQKLQAILTLVNSLQAVMNSLQSEGAAMQTLLAAKTALLNTAKEIDLAITARKVAAAKVELVTIENSAAIQTVVAEKEQIMNVIKGEGLAISAKSVAAKEAETVAQEGYTVATEGAEVATLSLRATLIASGIGILILAIVGAVAYLISSMKNWDDEIKENAKNQKAWADAIVKQNEIINEQIALHNKAKVAARDKLQADLDNAESLGTSQEKSLALQAQIADKNKEIAQDAIVQHGGYQQILTDIDSQTDALDKNLDVQRKAADEVKRLKDLQSKGVKTVETVEQVHNIRVSKEGEIFNLPGTHTEKVKLDISDVIKKNQTIIDDTNDTVEAQKKAIDELKAVDKSNTDATAEQNRIRLAIAKLSADQQRRIALETARIEAEEIMDANNRILSDERSTQQQRLGAVKSNALQRSKVIQAELKAELHDPTKNSDDKIIAQKKADEQEIINERDTKQKLFDIDETFRKRRLAAELEVRQIKNDFTKSTEESLFNNSDLGLNDRLAALKKYEQAQQDSTDAVYQHTIATTVLTNEERLAVDADYNAKSVANAADLEAKVIAILKDQISQETNLREDGVKAIQRVIDGLDLVNTKQYSEDVQALNKALQEKKISYTEYDHKRREIDAKYSISTLQNLKTNLQDQLALYNDNTAEIATDQEELSHQQDLLYLAESDLEKKSILAYIQYLQDKIKADKAYADKRTDILKQMYDTDAKLSDENTKKKKEKDDDYFSGLEKKIDTFGQLFNNIIATFSTISDIGYQNQKAGLDNLEKAQQDHYDEEVKNINRSSLAEESKTEKLQILEGARAAQKEDNEKRLHLLEVKRARAEKIQNIGNIISSTALAVVRTLGDTTIVPGYLRIPLAVTVGALGAAQLAQAISAPLPQYKTGRGYGKEELAITGDGGVSEYIVREDGSIEKTPAIRTLTHLMPQDRVLKNEDALKRELAIGAIPIQKYNYTYNNPGGITVQEYDSISRKMTSSIVGAVENIQVSTMWITKSGWVNQNQRIADTNNWVSKRIKGK